MSIDQSLGFIVSQAARRLNQLLTLQYQPYEITTEQWAVLNRLSEQDGINQKDLASRAEKDPTNVTRILDQLERKGLVERKPNASDRRSLLAYITDRGTVLNEKLLPIEKKVVNSILTGLTDDQIQMLSKLLIHITRNANRYIREVEE